MNININNLLTIINIFCLKYIVINFDCHLKIAILKLYLKFTNLKKIYKSFDHHLRNNYSFIIKIFENSYEYRKYIFSINFNNKKYYIYFNI